MAWWLAWPAAVAAFVLWRLSLKRFVFMLIGVYKRASLLLLRLRGHTPASVAEARVVRSESWDEFCEALKAAGAVLHAPGAPRDPFTQAEGYRYLSRLTRAALENFVECSDVRAPRLCSIADGMRAAPVKLGSDNPDNLYLSAVISSELTYVVRGSRGTVRYLGLGTQCGAYGAAGGLRTVDYVEADQLRAEASRDPPAPRQRRKFVPHAFRIAGLR